MHTRNERHRQNQLLFLAHSFTKIAQRIYKFNDIRYTSLTMDKELNSLIYRTPFYVNIYGSYKLLKPPCILQHLYSALKSEDADALETGVRPNVYGLYSS